MKRLKKITDDLFFGRKNENSGKGLFVLPEDLIGMRRYIAYMRALERRRSFSHQAGDIKSAFKGRGMELEEIRSYTFGDDVRDIDWRVTARKEAPYTKVFAEEKDREIYVWLDLSAPMVFGTRRELKTVAAAKAAALLGWLAFENKDRFGCIIFDGSESFLFRPQNNRAQLTAVFKKISEVSRNALQFKPAERSAAFKSLKLLEQNAGNRAAVFLLSDFSLAEGDWQKQLAGLAKKTQLFIFNIFDVIEELPPKAGEYMAEYGGKRLIFDSGDKLYRRSYQNYFAEKRSRLKEFCTKFNCKLVEFRTDREIADNLKFL